jgi:SAM-dependent methyltransferase
LIEDIYRFWNIDHSYAVADHFTGYEDLYYEFDKHTKETYTANPQETINNVFNLYRNRAIVPIDYYTEHGLINAIKDFGNSKYNSVQGNVIGLGNNRGQKISRFVFTNMMTAEPKGRGSNSLRDRFCNDAKLKRAIRICFEFREGNNLVYPTALRRALELVTGENVQNFKPQNARAIVEHLCPQLWGRVYDYSAGYGGRLLGITASNMRYEYIGVDPNTETVNGLNYLNSLLNNPGTVVQSVSEEYQPEDIDLAFSSPPYFNLEKYSDEETQCMVRYSTLDQWFEGYVQPTIERIHRGLNEQGFFGTNIADYKTAKDKFQVCDRWIKLAEKIGFKYQGMIKMMLNTRPGVGNDKLAGREKYEGVYVFKKV